MYGFISICYFLSVLASRRTIRTSVLSLVSALVFASLVKTSLEILTGHRSGRCLSLQESFKGD